MEESGGGRHHDRGGPPRDAGRVAARCTVVVPAWRAETTLLRTLHSLLVDNADAVERVIVVGCATDRCLDIARRCSGVEVVALPHRVTAGRARNEGRAMARACEMLLFVDADCRIQAGAVERLIRRLVTGDFGAVGAAIAQDGRGFVGWLRHFLEFKEAAPGVPGRSPRFLPSTVLLVRTRVFDACGGFPDMWPGEDLVLSRRVLAIGARIEKVDDAVAFHTHPEGLCAYVVHQHRLGRTAAVARIMSGGQGAAFAGRPWLAPLLLCGRVGRGCAWLIRYRPREIPRFVSVLPLYLLGLFAWTLGFAWVPRTGAAR